ncbi:MAG: hypothetical protein ACOYOV_06825, partial [Bacteroidales bacterium]
MKKLSIPLWVLITFLLFSFTVDKPKTNADQKGKPISILSLDYGKTTIYLSDFVSDCLSIDSVTVENRIYKLNPDKKSFDFTPSISSKPIIELKIW